jgi:hypothetical protein
MSPDMALDDLANALLEANQVEGGGVLSSATPQSSTPPSVLIAATSTAISEFLALSGGCLLTSKAVAS